ncbi:uncharacterized protein LOC131968432 isoform X2 [Centropristis striata]|uniref:uncharacterized protein LOC131968432 isoform X2 n=1 Tax=Centropristis striata TaxID=184440 RepID=UPI0027E1DBE7|nr:uncharacterized protein LOC131968432 isoform X2 [Centropristis striata]
MAFANLFTRLSAVEEGVKSPGQPASTHRDETEDDKRDKARKRKAQAEHTGPYKKKQHYQAQTSRIYNAAPFKDDDSKAEHYHRRDTESEHARFGFTKEVMHNHSDKAGYNNMCHKGQNYKTRNNHNVNKRQKKNPKGQKNQHQQNDRWGPAGRGGGHHNTPTWRKDHQHKHDKQNVQVKRTRVMTQEFKDQNAVLVDGRYVCRHFLWGKCNKNEECQLEHIQGYNDLVKEVCKFYVQGFCTKGESCPYMHKSFPCKFFHRKGKCSQGADCRFSHEPLNDDTNQLLNEALKRDKDLYELTKKAEQEMLGQPEKTDESEIIEANGTPDTLLQPLRPNFYNSTETNAEKETSCQTEEPTDVMEEAEPQHASDASQHHTALTSTLNHAEPVCYSVAAVLGPQLSKPFFRFFTTPESEESGSLSSSDCTSGSANQSKVPYSVDAVLGSWKSVENATFCHTTTLPTTQSASYTPKSDFKEITDPLLNSETHNEKVLHSVKTRSEVNKSQQKMFKSLSSPQVETSLVSKICPSSLVLASTGCRKQHGNMPASLKSAQRAADEVKLDLCHSPVTVARKMEPLKNIRDVKGRMHVPSDITCSAKCKSEDVLPFGPANDKSIFSRPTSQTNTSKHTMPLGPHLAVRTSDSQASIIKPFGPSSGLMESKDRAAVPIEPATSSMKKTDSATGCHFAAKQPTEIHLQSRKTQSALEHGTHQYSAEMTPEGSIRMEHGGDLAVGCKKTLKRPFHTLFASPITDISQPVDHSVSSSCPPGFMQASCPTSQSGNCGSYRVKSAAEPDKASARSFLSLFAAPLSAASPPCMKFQQDDSRSSSGSQQPIGSADKTHSSDSKQSASNLKTLLPSQARANIKEIPHVPRSPNSSPNSKMAEDSSAEPINQPTQQLVNPVLSLVSSSLSEKTTSLSTTHADQQLPNISSRKGAAVAATANSVLKTLFQTLSPYQQDGEQPDRLQISVSSGFPAQQSSEKAVEHPTEHQPAFQSQGVVEPEVRNSGTHNLPCKPLMQHHSQQRQKQSSEEGKSVNGSVVATPLKDLFKTLEPAGFHFGP